MIDGHDAQILQILQEDGRISNKELADRIGLSASATLERTRRLERDGVIQGYAARLDPAAVGLGVRVLLAVTLSDHRRETHDAFVAAIRALPAVRSAFHVSGATDFVLEVAVPDVASLERLLSDAIGEIDAVSKVRTSLILDAAKEGGAWLPPGPVEGAGDAD